MSTVGSHYHPAGAHVSDLPIKAETEVQTRWIISILEKWMERGIDEFWAWEISEFL